MKLTLITAAALLAVCLACPLLAEGGEPPRSQAQNPALAVAKQAVYAY
ncbi:MAG: hypothetical protein ACRED0_05180 [Gammaproteobacteria bacterium]